MPLKSHLLSDNEFSGCKGTAFFSFRQIFSPVFLKTSDPFGKKRLTLFLISRMCIAIIFMMTFLIKCHFWL